MPLRVDFLSNKVVLPSEIQWEYTHDISWSGILDEFHTLCNFRAVKLIFDLLLLKIWRRAVRIIRVWIISDHRNERVWGMTRHIISRWKWGSICMKRGRGARDSSLFPLSHLSRGRQRWRRKMTLRRSLLSHWSVLSSLCPYVLSLMNLYSRRWLHPDRCLNCHSRHSQNPRSRAVWEGRREDERRRPRIQVATVPRSLWDDTVSLSTVICSVAGGKRKKTLSKDSIAPTVKEKTPAENVLPDPRVR